MKWFTWLVINCEGLQRRKLRTGGNIGSIQPHLVIYYHGCAQKWNITIGMESLVIFTHNPQRALSMYPHQHKMKLSFH